MIKIIISSFINNTKAWMECGLTRIFRTWTVDSLTSSNILKYIFGHNSVFWWSGKDKNSRFRGWVNFHGIPLDQFSCIFPNQSSASARTLSTRPHNSLVNRLLSEYRPALRVFIGIKNWVLRKVQNAQNTAFWNIFNPKLGVFLWFFHAKYFLNPSQFR